MLKSLRDITQKVASAESLDSALSFLVTQTKVAVKTEACSVYLLEQQRLMLLATDGLAMNAVGSVSFAVSEGLIGFTAKQKEILNLARASDHPNYKKCAEIKDSAYNGFLAAPIIFQKQILGVIVIQQKKACSFNETIEAFVMTLAAQLASVIHSLRLRDELGAHVDRIQYKGSCASRGIAIAPALVLGGEINFQTNDVKSDAIDNELERLQTALERSRESLKVLSQKFSLIPNNEVYSIVTALESLLDDKSLGGEFVTEIKQGWIAESAVSRVAIRLIKQFNEMQDPYLRERAFDIKDLGQRVLRELIEPEKVRLNPKNPVILVVKEADTSLLADFPSKKLAGIVTELGGVNSHAAIVARALNIPALTGVEQIFSIDLDNKLLVVDATHNALLVSPSPSIISEYRALITSENNLQKKFESELGLLTETLDHKRIHLYLNAGLIASMDANVINGADGIGLYRTEINFMMEHGFPTEMEQIKSYQHVINAAQGKPVVMRTLDIGGDKPLPYFPVKEQNPFLGWRGIRFSLDHPELFLIQLRAMLQSTQTANQLSILLPMVSAISEIDSALSYLNQAYNELVSQTGLSIPYPKIGIMLEVPALLFQLKDVAERVDFISVGSNDLTQYLLAVDRNNPQVSDLFDGYHPGILRTLRRVLFDCKQYGLDISICGELASEPMGTLLLVAMGFDKLSMNQTSLARINYLIRRVSEAELKLLLSSALEQSKSRDVKQLILNFLKNKKLDSLLN